MLVSIVMFFILLKLIDPKLSAGGCLIRAAARVFELMITVILLWLLFHMTH